MNKEELKQYIQEHENPCSEEIMKLADDIINIPIPYNMMLVTKKFLEIVSILQGELDAVTEMSISQEIEIRLLKQKLKGD